MSDDKNIRIALDGSIIVDNNKIYLDELALSDLNKSITEEIDKEIILSLRKSDEQSL